MTKKRNAAWSKIIEEHGVQIRIFERERGSLLYRSVIAGGKKDRKSLGHRDRTLAEQQARALARALAEMRLTGATEGLTLVHVFTSYRETKLPQLTADRRQAAETRMSLFTRAWGRIAIDNIDQSKVDAYATARMSGELSPLEVKEGKGRKPAPVRAGTIDSDMRWLNSAFNAARKRRINGKPLLRDNPLHGLEWPRERNVRRPVASGDRYARTQQHADAVDPAGRLSCALAIARFTGHRESAILNLRASDLLLSVDRVRAGLIAVGRNEQEADHMPFGAVLWRAEHDKQGVAHISPLSRPAREAIDAYLRLSARMGDAVLFPSPTDDTAAMSRYVASAWLLRAEQLAELPKLPGGLWHPYRRAWATERKHLPDVDVAAAGGWGDTRALKLSYQQADAATMLRVVEGA